MIPTLKIGDHIFVNKFSYGLWIPFVGKKWRMGQGPKRGDVVVFIYPVDPSKDFIKRVVGLPGDEIIIKYNKLHINGQLVTTEAKDLYTYSEQETPHSIAAERTCRVHQANIFGAIHQILLDEEHPSSLQNWNANHSPQGATKPWKGPKIPPGYVFVMGDNRDHSSDSREWGLVPIENIKGKAVLVWLSFGGEKGFRWDRIFVPIR
jgi:signal peptidase I